MNGEISVVVGIGSLILVCGGFGTRLIQSSLARIEGRLLLITEQVDELTDRIAVIRERLARIEGPIRVWGASSDDETKKGSA